MDTINNYIRGGYGHNYLLYQGWIWTQLFIISGVKWTQLFIMSEVNMYTINNYIRGEYERNYLLHQGEEQSILNIHTEQSCLVVHSHPGVRLRETWYAPETLLACFLLATTVTVREDLTATGDNCKEEAGLWIWMIFTNLVLALLFWQMEGGDSLLYND